MTSFETMNAKQEAREVFSKTGRPFTLITLSDDLYDLVGQGFTAINLTWSQVQKFLEAK
jgi:hypothetical protein